MSDSHVKGRTYGGAYILYRCTQVHTHPYTHGCTVLSPDTHTQRRYWPIHTYRFMVLPSTHKVVWYSPSQTYGCREPHHMHTPMLDKTPHTKGTIENPQGSFSCQPPSLCSPLTLVAAVPSLLWTCCGHSLLPSTCSALPFCLLRSDLDGKKLPTGPQRVSSGLARTQVLPPQCVSPRLPVRILLC